MLRVFFTSVFLFILSQNAFAGKYYIEDISKSKKDVYYNRTKKIAELRYSYGWKVSCENGRKRGNSSRSYKDLKTAYKFAVSECKK
jgi:hypothetical protein